MIKKFRPKKILEVGIAAGGSTAIILQTLEDLGEPYEMHSVDVAEKFYRDPSKSTGFMAAFAKENNLITPPRSTLCGEHKFHLGKYLPQFIDDIGEEIDFVILDTVHSIPGEVLDFLAVLPYLKDDSIVVLHDVAENQLLVHNVDSHATTALFSAVTAEKFLNFDEQALFRYPNIAAFKVNEQTAENIDNVFLSLILRWKYLPPEEQVVAYRKLYRRFYPAELCEIFQEAVDMNAFNFWRANHK